MIHYELVVYEEGKPRNDYTVSKHRTLKDAEKALVKFKTSPSRTITHNVSLRIDRVDSGS